MKITRKIRALATALISGAVALACTGPAQAAGTHSAAVIDTRADVLAQGLPSSCTYTVDAESVLTVAFTEGLTGTVAVPENFGAVVFNLNGQTIKGVDGKDRADNDDGAPAITVGSNTELTLAGPGAVIGGDGADGANGNPPGRGGAGAVVDVGGKLNVGEGVTVTGGRGGKGADNGGAGGNGGAGVDGSVSSNNGEISGGAGGVGGTGNPQGGTGGNGGPAVTGEGPTSGTGEVNIGPGGTGGDGLLPGAGGEGNPPGGSGTPTVPGGFDPIPWTPAGTNEHGVAVYALTNNVTAPLRIPDNLGAFVLDLNGKSIIGASGQNGDETTPGARGGTAISIVPTAGEGLGPTVLTVVDKTATAENKTHVTGGKGGDGNPAGQGGAGISAEGARNGVVVNIGENVVVSGGRGGKGLGGGVAGGDGGVGVEGDVGSNQGNISDGERGEQGAPSDPFIASILEAFKGAAEVRITTDGEGRTVYGVTMTNDVTGPIDIPAGVSNIVVDLNGKTITGAHGTETEKDGRPAITVEPGTELTLTGEGNVIGGNGVDGDPAGSGGAGIVVAEGGKVNIGEGVTVKGGQGGNGIGSEAAGGAGGAGVDGEIGTNNGDVISGGDGSGVIGSDRIKVALDFNNDAWGNSNVVFSTANDVVSGWTIDRNPRHAAPIGDGTSMRSSNNMIENSSSFLKMVTPHGGTLSFDWGVMSQRYIKNWMNSKKDWGSRLVVYVTSVGGTNVEVDATFETANEYPKKYSWEYEFSRDHTNAVVKLPRGMSEVMWVFENYYLDETLGEGSCTWGWVDNVKLDGADSGADDEDLTRAINENDGDPLNDLPFTNDRTRTWSVVEAFDNSDGPVACTPELLGPGEKTRISSFFENGGSLSFSVRLDGGANTDAVMRCYVSQTFVASTSRGETFERTVTNLVWQTGETLVSPATADHPETKFTDATLAINGSGRHELIFEFKNGSTGGATGYLDCLRFTPSTNPEGGDSINSVFTDKDGYTIDPSDPDRPRDLEWTSGGMGRWFGQGFVTCEGPAAMQSGEVRNLEGTEWLSAEFDGRGVFSWCWKTYCAKMSPGDDGMTGAWLQLDDAAQDRSILTYPGTGRDEPWSSHFEVMGRGHHRTMFIYTKNMVPATDTSADAAWVDCVQWCPYRVWNRLEEIFSEEDATVTYDPTGKVATVTLKRSLSGVSIDDDLGTVVIDLKGHSIVGASGDPNGDANGQAAITIAHSTRQTSTRPTQLILIGGTDANPAEVKGGDGAKGTGTTAPGNGGAGILVGGDAINGVGVTVGAKVDVVGGTGGQGTGNQVGGNGGAGVDGNVTDNNGTITGGTGGEGGTDPTSGGQNGGNGGSGVTGGVGKNDGVINGGDAGKGADGTPHGKGGTPGDPTPNADNIPGSGTENPGKPATDGQNTKITAVEQALKELNVPYPPVTVSIDADGRVKVSLTNNMTSTLVIPDQIGTVKLDLGGHTIHIPAAKDGDATKAGEDGQPGVRIVSHGGTLGATELDIVGGTSGKPEILGGNGGNGHPAGKGGAGVEVAPGTVEGVKIAVGPDVDIQGGVGGMGLGADIPVGIGDGGIGGAGIDGSVTNNTGTISGGQGGKSEHGQGGAGGTGVTGNVTNNGGTIIGGNGGEGGVDGSGNGQAGGNGGDGVGGSVSGGGGFEQGGTGGKGGDGSGTGDGGKGGNGGDGDQPGSGGTGGSAEQGTGGQGGTGGNNTGDNGNGGAGGAGGNSTSGAGGAGGVGGNGSGTGTPGQKGPTGSGKIQAEALKVVAIDAQPTHVELTVQVPKSVAKTSPWTSLSGFRTWAKSSSSNLVVRGTASLPDLKRADWSYEWESAPRAEPAADAYDTVTGTGRVKLIVKRPGEASGFYEIGVRTN